MAKGKFKSARQRRFLFAVAPAAAHKWAHNMNTTKADWVGVHRSNVKAKAKARAKGR